LDPLACEDGLVEKDMVRLFTCDLKSTGSADERDGDDDMEMGASAVSPVPCRFDEAESTSWNAGVSA
jgi:hypothetical protein